MKGRCSRCDRAVDSDGCQIVKHTRDQLWFLGKDGGFHEISIEKESKKEPEPEIGPAAAKLARILARQAAREKEQQDNGNQN